MAVDGNDIFWLENVMPWNTDGNGSAYYLMNFVILTLWQLNIEIQSQAHLTFSTIYKIHFRYFLITQLFVKIQTRHWQRDQTYSRGTALRMQLSRVQLSCNSFYASLYANHFFTFANSWIANSFYSHATLCNSFQCGLPHSRSGLCNKMYAETNEVIDFVSRHSEQCVARCFYDVKGK